MSSISMPDLPDGPRRRFAGALYACYRSAGCPTLKAIAEWVGGHPELPATVSKETVRRMLVGLTVPLTWTMAETVFLALCGMAGRDPDGPDDDLPGSTRREAFHRYWRDAVADSSSISRRTPG